MYTQEELIELIKPILEKHFVSKAAFFGSYARNEQTMDSDLDMIVDFPFSAGLEFFSLLVDLEDRVNMHVDLEYYPDLLNQSKRFYNSIKNDEVVFFEKNFN